MLPVLSIVFASGTKMPCWSESAVLLFPPSAKALASRYETVQDSRSMVWAIVTGASAGIGRDISLELAARGYDVVLVARRQDKLQELADEIRQTHRVESLVVAADLSQADGCRSVFTACGDREVGVLVNNAGFGLRQSFVEADLQKQLEMVRLNIEAVVHLTGLFAPAMLKRGRGRVLNLGSSAKWRLTSDISARCGAGTCRQLMLHRCRFR